MSTKSILIFLRHCWFLISTFLHGFFGLLLTAIFTTIFASLIAVNVELFGLKGISLDWVSWIMRILVALVLVWFSYNLILHPGLMWRKLGRLRRRMFKSKQEPSKPQEISTIQQIAPEQPKSRTVNRRRFIIETGALSAIAAEGIFWEPSYPRIVPLDLTIPGLPAAFEGFTIAHVTDIHVDAYTTPDMVASWVSEINSFKPDLSVVTGDFVNNGHYYIDLAAETLGKLRDGARFGAYGCSGNHDHYAAGADLGSLEPVFKKQGLPLLRNTATELRLNGDSLWLLGTDDNTTHLADLPRALKAMGLNNIADARRDLRSKILLAHNPTLTTQVIPSGINLMLSGHTHGSQVYIPGFSEVLVKQLYPQFRGYYRLNDLQLYVNSGIGLVGTPLRFLTRPEIALLKLHSGKL